MTSCKYYYYTEGGVGSIKFTDTNGKLRLIKTRNIFKIKKNDSEFCITTIYDKFYRTTDEIDIEKTMVHSNYTNFCGSIVSIGLEKSIKYENIEFARAKSSEKNTLILHMDNEDEKKFKIKDAENIAAQINDRRRKTTWINPITFELIVKNNKHSEVITRYIPMSSVKSMYCYNHVTGFILTNGEEIRVYDMDESLDDELKRNFNQQAIFNDDFTGRIKLKYKERVEIYMEKSVNQLKEEGTKRFLETMKTTLLTLVDMLPQKN